MARDGAEGVHADSGGVDGDSPQPGPRRVVALGAMLSGAMGIAPFPLFIIMALGPLVISDLGLSRTAFGSVTTVAFATGLAGSLLAGRLVDRVGAPRVAVVMVVLASAAIGVAAGARGYVWLAGAAVLCGLTQAASNPATNVLISHTAPPALRGALMGVKQSGVQMGQFLAGAALPAIAVAVGWRASALTGLVVTAAVLALVLATVPPWLDAYGGERRSRAGAAVDSPAAAHANAAPQPPATPVWLLVYTFLVALVVQALNAYIPLYAFEDVGLSAAAAGSAVGVVGVVGVAARIAVGWASGRLASSDTLLVAVAVIGAGAVALTASAGALGAPLLWVGVVSYAATALTANVLVMAALLERVAGRGLGRASGVVQMALFGGFAAGPVAFGALVDATSSYVLGWLAAVAALVAAGALAEWGRRQPRGRPVAR